MTEASFAEDIADALRTGLRGDPCRVSTKTAVLYTISFGEDGHLELGLDATGAPVRGKGTGFEQDILVYDQGLQGAHTSLVPRVVIETKLRRVTTHDAIVYSEKARRIRQVYPFIRYGLLLGEMKTIPARVLRLGQEFDFVAAVDTADEDAVQDLFEVVLEELGVARAIAPFLRGKKAIRTFRRQLTFL